MASLLGLGACASVGSTPATTSPTTAVPTTSTSTTTTLPVTTTTLDRLTEIQAIFQDLEVRRLQAILDQDEEAFRSVFANDEYADRSMVLMGDVPVIDPQAAIVDVTNVFIDERTCIAVAAVVDASESIQGGGICTECDHVGEMSDGVWGISWVGEGWRCDGPHPFSG
jgi:hypothetical protein